MAFLAGMDGCIGMVLGTGWLLIWSGGISCNSSAAYSLSLERFLEENNKKAPCYLLISSFFLRSVGGYDGNSLWRPWSFGIDRGAHGEDSNRKELCFGSCTNHAHTPSLLHVVSFVCPLCSKANSTFYDYAARLARQKAQQQIIAQQIMSYFAFVHFIAIWLR
jgi:hypothetical protein